MRTAIAIMALCWCAVGQEQVALPAKIHAEIVTNWVTTSIETPAVARGEENDLVYRQSMAHQAGTIKSNAVAEIMWKGTTVTTVLESTDIGTTTRTISQAPGFTNLGMP